MYTYACHLCTLVLKKKPSTPVFSIGYNTAEYWDYLFFVAGTITCFFVKFRLFTNLLLLKRCSISLFLSEIVMFLLRRRVFQSSSDASAPKLQLLAFCVISPRKYGKKKKVQQYETGQNGRVLRWKPLLTKNNTKSHFMFAKTYWGSQKTWSP